MPLIKKSSVSSPKSIFINFILLFSAASANAGTDQLKQSKLLDVNHHQKTESNEYKSSFDSLSISNSKIIQNIATESSNNGSPALRRQPAGGERFEPKRIPLTLPFPKEPYRASPSITIINPSGYGASWGNAGIGVGFQERARFTDESDGVIGVGFGLGNAQKNLGAQIGVSLVDVSAPFRDGAVNLKLHRRLPEDFAVALGVQGLFTWGDTDGGSSVYGAATKRIKLRQDRTKAFSEIYTTVGVGGGQFRSESDINDGNDTVGVFGSIAIKLIQPVGFVAEWTGQDLTIGIPLVPFRKLPFVIVPAVTDITGSAGDGTRFVIGFGYTFSF
ncbi:MAG: hypothetical protein AAF298_13885 [Cyanobacteria bacterium P01_A01_bin.40]